MQARHSWLTKTLKGALKCLIALTILWFLVKFNLLDIRLLQTGLNQPALLLSGALLVAANLLGTAFRCWWLIRAAGLQCTLKRALEMCLVGLFFNTFLFGGAGGDVARVVMLGRTVGSRPLAAASILADRSCGLFGLVLIAAIATLAYPDILMSHFLLRCAGLTALSGMLFLIAAIGAGYGESAGRRPITVTMLVGCVCLGALIGWWWMDHDGSATAGWASAAFVLSPIIGVGASWRLAHHRTQQTQSPGALQLFLLSCKQYLGLPKVVIIAILTSTIAQIPLILALPLFAHSMSLEPGDFSAVTIAGAIALLANVLPLPAGGLGAGEAAYGLALQTVPGVEANAQSSVFLMLRVWLIIFGLLSGLLLLRSKAHSAGDGSPTEPASGSEPEPKADDKAG